MKIVSWNCGGWSCGGFTIERYNKMLQYQPDIILIQECTKKEFESITFSINEARRTFIKNTSKGKFYDFDDSKFQHWYGDDAKKSYKGVAIFSANCIYNIELIDNFNNNFRYIIPYKISLVSKSFFEYEHLKEYILLSVWTKPNLDGSGNYQKTIFKAFDYYNFSAPIIIAGDFNTGANKKYTSRYNELKSELEKRGLKNCAENTNYEYEPTFFHDKVNDYFTNDFCFISKNLNVYNFYVDKMENQKRWHGLSDHCPIIADFGELTKHKTFTTFNAKDLADHILECTE